MRLGAVCLVLISCEPAPAQDPHVRTLKLDVREPDLPAGPGRDLFMERCMACHSATYVIHQPPLSAEAWTAVVAKMRSAYGAALDDTTSREIVEYITMIAPKG